MSDDLIKDAEALAAYHRAEADRWDQFVAMAKKVRAERARVDGVPQDLLVHAAEHTRRGPHRRRVLRPGSGKGSALVRLPGGSPTKEVLDKAVEVLTKHGAPMRAANIYDQLVAEGITVSGQNPKANLTAKFAMRRDLLSYSSETGMWSLAAWEQEGAG